MQKFDTAERNRWLSELPDNMKTRYQLGHYPQERLHEIMWKYLVRSDNTKRSWVRIWQHMPETMLTNETLDILEFSTAHGAMLEIWRDKGHNVRGTDFNWAIEGSSKQHKGIHHKWQKDFLIKLTAEKAGRTPGDVIPGWPYQPIIESLDLDVDLFDAGQLPYAYGDNSFDVVCCYQAIEAYTHADRWMDVVREFCRIARKSVVVGFNPLSQTRMKTEAEAAQSAWHQMQTFNECGFVTTFFEIGETRRGIHPIAVKFSAVE